MHRLLTKSIKSVCIKRNFHKEGKEKMVRNVQQTPTHPHHTLVIRVNQVSTSGNLGSRIVIVEKSSEEPIQNIWELFTRLAPMAASEKELIEAMNMEVPGLGEVARVFGTHAETTREEDIWEILDFFMGIHINLHQTPRMAWTNPTLREKILIYAKTCGHHGSI